MLDFTYCTQRDRPEQSDLYSNNSSQVGIIIGASKRRFYFRDMVSAARLALRLATTAGAAVFLVQNIHPANGSIE
jgi:hypothetical protein